MDESEVVLQERGELALLAVIPLDVVVLEGSGGEATFGHLWEEIEYLLKTIIQVLTFLIGCLCSKLGSTTMFHSTGIMGTRNGYSASTSTGMENYSTTIGAGQPCTLAAS